MLRKPVPPLNVIVSGSGHVDPGLPVFATGVAPAVPGQRRQADPRREGGAAIAQRLCHLFLRYSFP